MNQIKETIRRSGLRKNFIAMQIGTYPSHISMWIAGERTPSPDKLRKLIKILGCKVNDLYPEGYRKDKNG